MDDEKMIADRSRPLGRGWKGRVVRVHDGDTIEVEFPTFKPTALSRWMVRLNGYDAPELHDDREEMKKLAERAHWRLTELALGEHVVLTTVWKDKFFRLLADIELEGKDLGESLLNEGLVREYSGEGPKPW